MWHNRKKSIADNNIKTLPDRTENKELLIGLAIFTLALLVRLFYLYESSSNPSFLYPTVDSHGYVKAARSLASGVGMNEEFFYQPFFYPLFLSAVFFFSNSSIVFVKLVQVLLGSITCLLTYNLGRQIFGRSAGIIAAVITALYGPLIFFECELLASGWAAFWSVALILLFIKSAREKTLRLCMLLGVCGALSTLTRPTFLPFFTAAVLWLTIVFYRAADKFKKIALRLCAVAGGFLLIVIPVSTLNLRITSHFAFLPSSGGMNVYIGNNPNYTETVTARPGWQWEDITRLPEKNGVAGDIWAQQKFFKRQVLNYIRTEPTGFVKGLIYKCIQFLNSREIPRNLDVYMFKKWSPLLGVLTWKSGGFGFPFGVLLPLSFLGLVSCRRKLPAAVLLFLLLYPLSIILVFVTARYRVVVIPVMSLVAAAGVINLFETVRRVYWRRIAAIFVFGTVIILLSTLPCPFPQEQFNFEAEFCYSIATLELENEPYDYDKVFHYLDRTLQLMPDYVEAQCAMAFVLEERGRLDEAISRYQRTLALKPDYIPARYGLAKLLTSRGRLDEVISCYHQIIQLSPNDARAYYNLAIVLKSQGRLDEAISHYEQAIQLKPDHFNAHRNLANILSARGRFDEATQHYEQALRIQPDSAEIYYNMALLLKAQGLYPEAVRYLRQALQLDPKLSGAHYTLGLLLQLQNDTQEAIYHYLEALKSDPNLAEAHNNLASILITTGRPDEALQHFTHALRIKPDYVTSLNGAARILATASDPAVSDTSQAVVYAERAAELTKHLDINILDTLSVAYASAGRIDQAASVLRQAIAICTLRRNSEAADYLSKRLESLERKSP